MRRVLIFAVIASSLAVLVGLSSRSPLRWLADAGSTSESSLKIVQRLSRPRNVTGLAWSPDGKKLATFSNYTTVITIWDASDWHIIREFRRNSNGYDGNNFVWLSSGQILTPAAPQSQEDNRFSLSLWDPESGGLVKNIPGPDGGNTLPLNDAMFFGASEDNATVAMAIFQARGKVFLLDSRTWSIRTTLTLPQSDNRIDFPNAFSFAAKHLAVGTISGKLDIFDLASNTLERTITAFPNGLATGVESVAYNPDGSLLAAAPSYTLVNIPKIGDPLRVWRTQTGELATTFASDSGTFRQLAWSPDGNLLAAAGDDRTLSVWSMRSKKADLFQWLAGNVFAASFSRDGTLAAAAGDQVVVLK